LSEDPRSRSGAPPISPAIELPITPAVRPPAMPGPVIQPVPSASPRAVAPPVASAPRAAGVRTHTVLPKETLYGISTKYYGHGRNVEALLEANRDVLRSSVDLKIGMTLKIPPVAAPSEARR